MTIKALPKFMPQWFTPKSQEKETNPARFKINGLTGPQFLEVNSETSPGTGGLMMISGRGLNLAVGFGLTEWEGFVDVEGKDLPCTRENISFIPSAILSELSTKILDLSSPDEEETKNSSSQ